MTVRAIFDIAEVTPERVYIVDRCDDVPVPSITNDAVAVVEFLLMLYPGRRIFYLDTQPVWDELVHDGSKFVEFRSGADSDIPQFLLNMAT